MVVRKIVVVVLSGVVKRLYSGQTGRAAVNTRCFQGMKKRKSLNEGVIVRRQRKTGGTKMTVAQEEIHRGCGGKGRAAL